MFKLCGPHEIREKDRLEKFDETWKVSCIIATNYHYLSVKYMDFIAHFFLPHRDTQLERKIIIREYDLSSYNFTIIFYVMAIAINGIPELLDFKLL